MRQTLRAKFRQVATLGSDRYSSKFAQILQLQHASRTRGHTRLGICTSAQNQWKGSKTRPASTFGQKLGDCSGRFTLGRLLPS